MQDSYHTPGFAEFYDLMGASLPPEFEAGTDVGSIYWPMLAQLAAGSNGRGNGAGSGAGGCNNEGSTCSTIATGGGGSSSGGTSSSSAQRSVGCTGHNPAGASTSGAGAANAASKDSITVLDVCCGSGRVALDLAAWWASWPARPASTHLQLVGVDSSQEMLAAAQGKAEKLHAAGSTTGSGGSSSLGGSGSNSFSVAWDRADAAALLQEPALAAALRGRCSLVVLSAGSFHHMTTAASQAACLRGLAACLRPPSAGPAYAVVNIFGQADLQAMPGAAAVVGPFRVWWSQQQCLQR